MVTAGSSGTPPARTGAVTWRLTSSFTNLHTTCRLASLAVQPTQTASARARAEAWARAVGDFLATTIHSVKNRVSDAKHAKDGLGEPREYPMGAWAANREGGIRDFPHNLVSSLDVHDARCMLTTLQNLTINPSAYKT